ncbi:MAG: riboflavin biosynthesis protein RibF [Gammaproteobacteria bacterium]|nr:bifunctional riboflavin kinase/FMN adenylyltransferase [Gammaproteobacteria bacterium]|tara:strand:- start:49 stop:930 length:882 start_codon:yes stop_codon:yes gene_type:complete
MNKFAATIGNFDGVHLGHQELIGKIKQTASKNNLKTKVITFNPYPFEFFQWKKKRILSEFDKNNLLNKLGIDEIKSIKFDEDFRNQSAEEFFTNTLLNENIKFLSVGRDFKFGKDRSGDIELLNELCISNKVELNILDDFKANNHKVSSTLVRELLAKNDFVAASKLLGRPYAISGNVIKGKSLGKRLSTPTANIDIDNVEFCFNGVFLGQIDKDNKSFFCIINFGPKPTFDDYRQSLEAHILDFDKNIYDQALSIKFLCKIRDQVKFNSVEELKNQINDDKNNARELLKSYE